MSCERFFVVVVAITTSSANAVDFVVRLFVLLLVIPFIIVFDRPTVGTCLPGPLPSARCPRVVRGSARGDGVW